MTRISIKRSDLLKCKGQFESLPFPYAQNLPEFEREQLTEEISKAILNKFNQGDQKTDENT